MPKYFSTLRSFLLRSNIFVSLCATALCIETSIVLNADFQSLSFYTFVFFSTLFTYNLYYFKSKEFGYYKILTVLGMLGAIVSFFNLTYIPYLQLGIIAVLSIIYTIPVFIPFAKSDSFSIQKVMLLISVWVLMTFFIPINHFVFSSHTLLYLFYRISLMSLLCILFFIKDEINFRKKEAAIKICRIGIVIQLVLCALIAIHNSAIIACIYVIITLLIRLLLQHIEKSKPSNLFYLGLVDGMMLLESIFVLLKFLLTK